jgi:Mn-dependent DtxR family transcriptional regulator
MAKESDILRIVKEDILEVVGRENKIIPLKFMKLEVKVSGFFISKAIKELEGEDLIKIFSEKKSGKEYIQLTKKGRVRAKVILEKHSVLEKYFKKKRSEEEAVKATNILEHYISTEVVDQVKKLSTSKKQGISLTKLGLNKESIITDIVFSDYGLFERLVSMGIFLGGKIRVMYKIPEGIVVNVGSKKFALGNDIAKGIEVLR